MTGENCVPSSLNNLAARRSATRNDTTVSIEFRGISGALKIGLKIYRSVEYNLPQLGAINSAEYRAKLFYIKNDGYITFER